MSTELVGSGDSEMGAKVLSWTFSIQYPFAGVLILRTPAQHLYYFVMTAYTPADFSDGLVGLAHSQGMWVRGNHTANGQCGITALRF